MIAGDGTISRGEQVGQRSTGAASSALHRIYGVWNKSMAFMVYHFESQCLFNTNVGYGIIYTNHLRFIFKFSNFPPVASCQTSWLFSFALFYESSVFLRTPVVT